MQELLQATVNELNLENTCYNNVILQKKSREIKGLYIRASIKYVVLVHCKGFENKNRLWCITIPDFFVTLSRVLWYSMKKKFKVCIK